jgi:hypothetical protein
LKTFWIDEEARPGHLEEDEGKQSLERTMNWIIVIRKGIFFPPSLTTVARERDKKFTLQEKNAEPHLSLLCAVFVIMMCSRT